MEIKIDISDLYARFQSLEERMAMSERFVKLSTAAQLLDCSENKVRELIREGALSVYWIAGMKRYKYSQIMNLAKTEL